MNNIVGHLPIRDQRQYLSAWIDLHFEFECQTDTIEEIPNSLDPHACIASMTDVAFMNGRKAAHYHYKRLTQKRFKRKPLDGVYRAFIDGIRWQRTYCK